VSIMNADFVSGTGTLMVLGTGGATGDTYSRIVAMTGGGTSFGSLVLNEYGGNVGIGTTNPATKLQVNGAVTTGYNTYTGAVTCGTTSVDFSTGNFYTIAPSGAVAAGTCNIALDNMQNGTSYTIVITGNATTNAVTWNWTGTGLTFKYVPANAATTAGKDTVYTFIKAGNNVYVSWIPGF